MNSRVEDTRCARFAADGFVALGGYFAGPRIGEVADEVERFIDAVVPTLPPEMVFYEDTARRESLKQIQRMQEHDEYFRALMFDSPLEGLAAELLGCPVRGVNLQYFDKPRGTSRATPPHQDGYYFMLDSGTALTMWLALDAVDEQSGCVRYVPGSHRRGARAHAPTDTLGFSQGIVDYDETDARTEIAFPADPGDLLVHEQWTIHRAEANERGAAHRRALGLIYYSADAVESTSRAARQRELMQRWKRSGRL